MRLAPSRAGAWRAGRFAGSEASITTRKWPVQTGEATEAERAIPDNPAESLDRSARCPIAPNPTGSNGVIAAGRGGLRGRLRARVHLPSGGASPKTTVVAGWRSSRGRTRNPSLTARLPALVSGKPAPSGVGLQSSGIVSRAGSIRSRVCTSVRLRSVDSGCAPSEVEAGDVRKPYVRCNVVSVEKRIIPDAR